MNKLIQEIHRTLLEGKELVLATIISDKGSTPRTSGSSMLVFKDGSISGTIGGGIIEGKIIQSALTLFGTDGAVIISYNLNKSGSRDDKDVVCGGEMQVLIENVPVDDENKNMFRRMHKETEAARPFLFFRKLSENGTFQKVDRAMQTTDGIWGGRFLSQEPYYDQLLDKLKYHNGKTSLFSINEHHYVVFP